MVVLEVPLVLYDVEIGMMMPILFLRYQYFRNELIHRNLRYLRYILNVIRFGITFIIYLSWRWFLPGNNLYFTFRFIFSFDFIQSTQCFAPNTTNQKKKRKNQLIKYFILKIFHGKEKQKSLSKKKAFYLFISHAIIQIRRNLRLFLEDTFQSVSENIWQQN